MQRMSKDLLLMTDGVVNLALGVVLAIFPQGFAKLMGVPIPSSSFYPSILGGVLIGIGLALLVQRFWGRSGVIGLGLEGAIVINFCGAGVLMAWLIAGRLSIPTRGYLFLWAVAILVLGIGAAEIVMGARRSRRQPR
jgi:vacuolar-type H+-ATPase subunit I/STV1